MKGHVIWINGRFVDIRDAKISVFDRGFLYGDAVFETMRSYAGIVFRLDEHLARIFRSFGIMKLRPPYDRRRIKESIYGTIESNRLKSASVRLTVTRGEGSFAIGRRDPSAPNVVISARDFEGCPARMYGRGISAKIVKARQNERAPLSSVKSANFLNHILARLDAEKGGCDEAILMNTRGLVAEAATSNIFLVKGNGIFTPSLESGALAGITRGVVIEMARGLGLRVVEGKVSPGRLIDAGEVFLTNSLVEILPVTSIDSRKIGRGKPGEITKLLHISYQKQVIRETLSQK